MNNTELETYERMNTFYNLEVKEEYRTNTTAFM